MKIVVRGTSHLAETLRAAARMRGFEVGEVRGDLYFAAQDVLDHSDMAAAHAVFEGLRLDVLSAPLVLVSQVPPGTTRKWAGAHAPGVFYQVDTIIVKKALERACHPEQIVVGCADPALALPLVYQEYLMAFECPVRQMKYESAEMVKCGINYVLSKQIEAANAVAEAAYACGAYYSEDVLPALRADARLGPHAYLEPGSVNQHLQRDVTTVRELASPAREVVEEEKNHKMPIGRPPHLKPWWVD